MTDYISRDAALKAMECINDSICEQQAVDALIDLPAADVEPVVRCKDCAYRNGDYCHNYDGIAYEQFVRMTDFCSRGERKKGEQDG